MTSYKLCETAFKTSLRKILSQLLGHGYIYYNYNTTREYGLISIPKLLVLCDFDYLRSIWMRKYIGMSMISTR